MNQQVGSTSKLWFLTINWALNDVPKPLFHCHPGYFPVFTGNFFPSLQAHKFHFVVAKSHAPRLLHVLLKQHHCPEILAKMSFSLAQEEKSTCAAFCSTFQGNLLHGLKCFSFSLSTALLLTFACRCAVWVRTFWMQVVDSNLSAL